MTIFFEIYFALCEVLIFKTNHSIIVSEPEKRSEKRRIFVAKQGSTDAAGQEGPQGGADAGARQKD